MDFIASTRNEMRIAEIGHRFGLGILPIILRVLLGCGDLEMVYREDILDFTSLDLIHDLSTKKSPSIIFKAAEVGVDGMDITSAASLDPAGNIANDGLFAIESPRGDVTGPQPEQTLHQGEEGQVELQNRHYLKYLPICYGLSDIKRVSHIEIRIINDHSEDDEQIFRRLRAVHNARIGWIRRLFSYLEVRRIEQVKVTPRIQFSITG